MKKLFTVLALALALVLAAAALTACSITDLFTKIGTMIEDELSATPDNGPEDGPEETDAGGYAGLDGGFEVSVPGLKMTIPEGFEEYPQSAAGQKLYVPDDYPKHSDNINISYTEGEGDIDEYTSSAFKSMVESTLGTTLSDYSFSKDKVDGADRVNAAYTVTVNGVKMYQELYVYIIGDTSVVSVTFTTVTGDFENEFAASKASIQIG